MSLNKKLKIVIDTNVLLVSISSKSKYHWLFIKMLNQEFEVFISNEILTEYEEIISSKYNKEVAKNVIRTLLLLPNVHQAEIYYNWNLIREDADDNKFVDCFIAANANLIITNDKHFDCVKEINFPQVSIMSIEEFRLLHN